MMQTIAVLLLSAATAQHMPPTPPGEESVKPYSISNENAGATPYDHDRHYKEFGAKEGLKKLNDRFVLLLTTDKRIKDIFRASDLARLRRTLTEQFCYILGGPCDYTGMTMAASHKDHGIAMREYMILVQLLQVAMEEQKISFDAQAKLLAKLAPMYRDIVIR